MVISSNTNEWPQDQIDETGLMASSGRVMEKPGQEQALKCPRCDSSNTKFCYYNNYSLSQPRHFCKACKRYWTRGGTLRNVPVGGGCRKNKRLRRSASTNDSSPSLPTHPSPNPPRIDVSSASNHINSLFYGLPTTPSDINFPFPSFNSRISNVDTGYDLQSRLNALGLGFPSAAMTSEKHHDDYRNGFDPNSQTQEGVVTNSLLSDYSLLGSSSSPMMASLIASSLQQKKPILGSLKEGRPTSHFQALFPFEDLQVAGNGDLGMFMKEVKMEDGNKMEWNFHNQNPIEPVGLSDPSLYWNQFGHPLI